MAKSRAQAGELIGGDGVRVQGIPTPKPASLVEAGTAIELAGPPPRFVGRGGQKLDAALDAFRIEVAGRRALDAGASTGGFTDCLLQRGAASVLAVDVGRGQLDSRLAADARVEVRDRTNIRHLTPAECGGRFEVVVGDLSFISLCTVAPALADLSEDDADVVLLVKPQFEVGKGKVGKGGVVTDAEARHDALDRVCHCLEAAGIAIRDTMTSPITGAKGNVEFLAWGRRKRRAA